jgi:hypothetical protein
MARRYKLRHNIYARTLRRNISLEGITSGFKISALNPSFAMVRSYHSVQPNEILCVDKVYFQLFLGSFSFLKHKEATTGAFTSG